MKKQNDEITLEGLAKIFLPKWWLILIVSVLFAGLLGGYSMFMKNDTYTSTGKYMMSKINMSDNNAQTGLNSGEIEAMQVMISNAKEMINTNNFAIEVVKRLAAKEEPGVELSEAQIASRAEQVKKMMKVSLSGTDTTCYYFEVTTSTPTRAQAIADIAGQLLVEEYKDKTVYAIEIARIDDPVLPDKPDSKNEIRNAVIGFAGGFLLSLVAIFVFSKFDTVVRTKEALEDNFDLPILGVVPRIEADK